MISIDCAARKLAINVHRKTSSVMRFSKFSPILFIGDERTYVAWSASTLSLTICLSRTSSNEASKFRRNDAL